MPLIIKTHSHNFHAKSEVMPHNDVERSKFYTLDRLFTITVGTFSELFAKAAEICQISFMATEENLPNWFENVKSNFSHVPAGTDLLMLQIGVYKGDCTEYLLNNHQVSQIIDVDTWKGSMEHSDVNSIHHLDFSIVEEIYDKKFYGDKRVLKMKMTSNLFFASQLLDEEFDFIYIDGAHTSTQVLLDGINSFSRLKVGGVLAFDDYTWPDYSGTLNNPRIGIDSWLKLFDGYFELLVENNQIWVKKIKN